MGRADDAERLKLLSGRMAALREELGRLRAERDDVLARLRSIPGPVGAAGRVAVKVAYGEAGEGLFLADLPPRSEAVEAQGASVGNVPAGKGSAVDTDMENR